MKINFNYQEREAYVPAEIKVKEFTLRRVLCGSLDPTPGETGGDQEI